MEKAAAERAGPAARPLPRWAREERPVWFDGRGFAEQLQVSGQSEGGRDLMKLPQTVIGAAWAIVVISGLNTDKASGAGINFQWDGRGIASFQDIRVGDVFGNGQRIYFNLVFQQRPPCPEIGVWFATVDQSGTPHLPRAGKSFIRVSGPVISTFMTISVPEWEDTRLVRLWFACQDSTPLGPLAWPYQSPTGRW